MLTRSIIAAAMLIGMALNPSQASARELGLTPSHVYALWVNINDSLIGIAGVMSGDASLRDTLSSMSPRKFDGKRPSDVLRRIGLMHSRFRSLGLSAQFSGPLTEDQQYDVELGLATPSDVFIRSGNILDGLVVWLIENTEKKQQISGSYTRRKFHDKTPSNVFGLVDLADRRLEMILSKLEARREGLTQDVPYASSTEAP